MSTVVCSSCKHEHKAREAKNGQAKLPGGWHRRGDEQLVCARCWDKQFVMRAVSVPVASVEEHTPLRSREARKLGQEGWREFRPALREAQLACLRVSNWTVAQLAQADMAVCAVARAEGATKIPAMPAQYLYPGATKLAPELAPGSVTALLRTVERRYRARRFHAAWLCREALPTYRDPTPVPIREQDLRVVADEQAVRLVVPVGRSGKWTLRLAGGPGHRRALQLLRLVAAGEVECGEVKLVEQAASSGDHRSTGAERSATKRRTRLMVKVAVWRPRQAAAGLDPDRVLHVNTGPSALVSHFMENDSAHQLLHEDQVRRWVVEHAKRLKRESDDLRAMPPERRENLVRGRGDRLRLHRDRMDTHVKKIAALLRDAAVRRHCGVIAYNDEHRDYILSYPWHALRQRLQEVCDEAGIVLRMSSEEVTPEGPAPLDMPESENTP